MAGRGGVRANRAIIDEPIWTSYGDVQVYGGGNWAGSGTTQTVRFIVNNAQIRQAWLADNAITSAKIGTSPTPRCVCGKPYAPYWEHREDGCTWTP